jgi:hypothetical protein
MKCIGAQDPPCIRCRKASRQCLTEQLSYQVVPAHQAGHGGTISSPDAGLSIDLGHRYPLLSTPPSIVNDRTSMDGSISASAPYASPQAEVPIRLPTIYSAAPVDTVVVSAPQEASEQDVQSVGSSNSSKRRRLEVPTQNWERPQNSSRNHTPQDCVSLHREDIRDMINL